jgi:hypothetical protein
MVATRQTQRKQRIAGTRLDLGRQHSCGRTPALARVATTLHNQHITARQSQLPGAGRSHCATADHHRVRARHYVALKLFETSGRTAA